MSCVTAVEGEWLAELGPMFFTVKESYKTRILHRQREIEEKTDMEREMLTAKNTPAIKPSSILTTPSLSMKRSSVIYTPGYNTPSGQTNTIKSEANVKRTPLILKAPVPGGIPE